MKRLVVLFLAVALGFALGSVRSRYYPSAKSSGAVRQVAQQPLPPSSSVPRDTVAGFSAAVDAVRPAVVHMVSAGSPLSPGQSSPRSRMDGFPRETERDGEASTGSGVIVAPDGIIVTNYHVVGTGGDVRVLLQDRREFRGTVIGADSQTDLAVVRIAGENLPFVPWGDSDRLRVGDYVLAVGSPFGLSSTVTMGIVSATGRTGMGITDYEDFIQTDAAINPGNSGGALVNAAGELVGINTAIVSEHGGYQGIGFAVPSNLCRGVLEQLLDGGVVRRGWLGIAVQEVDSALALRLGVGEVRGALVADIEGASPVRDAGLVPGDVIVSFDGHEISGTADFRNRVASVTPGREVEALAVRDGRLLRLRLSVGEKPGTSAGPPRELPNRPEGIPRGGGDGMEVRGLSPGAIKQLDLPPTTEGVLVSRVEKGGDAWRSGLRRGDIILEVNRRPIRSVSEYERARTETGSSHLFYIRRGGQSFFILLESPDGDG